MTEPVTSESIKAAIKANVSALIEMESHTLGLPSAIGRSSVVASPRFQAELKTALEIGGLRLLRSEVSEAIQFDGYLEAAQARRILDDTYSFLIQVWIENVGLTMSASLAVALRENDQAVPGLRARLRDEINGLRRQYAGTKPDGLRRSSTHRDPGDRAGWNDVGQSIVGNQDRHPTGPRGHSNANQRLRQEGGKNSLSGFSEQHKALFQELLASGLELHATNFHLENLDSGPWSVSCNRGDSDSAARLVARFRAAVRKAASAAGAPYRVNLMDWWIGKLARGKRLPYIEGLIQRSAEYCEELESNASELRPLVQDTNAAPGLRRDWYARDRVRVPYWLYDHPHRALSDPIEDLRIGIITSGWALIKTLKRSLADLEVSGAGSTTTAIRTAKPKRKPAGA